MIMGYLVDGLLDRVADMDLRQPKITSHSTAKQQGQQLTALLKPMTALLKPNRPFSLLVADCGPRLEMNDTVEVVPPPYSEQDRIWDAARHTLPENIPERAKLIAIMGPTGVGKSTFISKLTATEMKIGHNLNSCTQEVKEVPCIVGNHHVILVDTPGFNDTNRSDTEILTAVADWMKGSYEADMRLSGIIYLHDISDTRMTNSGLLHLKMFRNLCGDHNLKNVILATTKWGVTPLQDARRREKDLTSDTRFWRPMIAAGAVVRRFENSPESATDLVKKILDKGQKIVPTIQQEVVKGTKLADTQAGAIIEATIARLQKEHDQEKQALLEEVQRAKKEQNRSMQEALEVERQRLEKKMAEREEEARQLHMTTNEALQLRIKKLEEEQEQRTAEEAELAEEIEQFGQKVQDFQSKLPKKHKHMVRLGFWHSSWKCQVCKKKSADEGRWLCPDCGHVQVNVR
ncbi:MAG: hypothetical protein L6R36_008437 [Xanthoria steineri]|nr:MAG: hypothetical protein L6R36_008437 [Xanthoria steineri]